MGNIIHLGPLSWFADRKVVLGAMAAALGAAAPGLSAALVALDDGAPQYGGQIGQSPHERFLSSPENVGGFVFHVCPTSYMTGQNIIEFCSLVNSFFCIIKGIDKIFQRTEATEVQKSIFFGVFIFSVGPLLRNRKGPHRGSLEDQSINSRYSPGFEDGKTLSTKRMKGVGNLRPSQRRVAIMCF